MFPIPPGTLIVDFGADTVEISVLAQGGVVSSRLLKIGGNTMNEVICVICRREKCRLFDRHEDGGSL